MADFVIADIAYYVVSASRTRLQTDQSNSSTSPLTSPTRSSACRPSDEPETSVSRRLQRKRVCPADIDIENDRGRAKTRAQGEYKSEIKPIVTQLLQCIAVGVPLPL